MESSGYPDIASCARTGPADMNRTFRPSRTGEIPSGTRGLARKQSLAELCRRSEGMVEVRLRAVEPEHIITTGRKQTCKSKWVCYA